MKYRVKSNHYGYLAVLLVFLFMNNVQAQFHWTFNAGAKNVFKEQSGRVALRYSSSIKSPELVPGVRGKALRTDGYSVWLSGELPATLSAPVSISGWFALESYPTDTAGLFVLTGAKGGSWISASVDRFGQPLVGMNSTEKTVFFGAAIQLSRFQWFHVALNVLQDRVELFINGEKQQTVPLAGFQPRFESVLIGRDARQQSIGIFPLTAINGIIDEIRITQTPFVPSAAVKGEVAKVLQSSPDLSVPASRFGNDFNRPKYHLLPAANWTNETHGFIFYGGRYHIFNQKNASNLLLRQINWGHFSSPDLVNWTEHGPALTPEPGYDENGIWSGHMVLNNKGMPTIIYTAGGKKMGIGLAFPKDSGLVSWEKFKGNPVIPGQPAGYTRTDLRDPYVWKEGSKWYMIVGFGIQQGEEEKGTVLLYTSDDLERWTFLHTLFEGDPQVDNSGVFWEMPVFVKMNGKYILLVNKVPYKGVPAVALYWVGNFINEKFIPDNPVPQKLEVINRLLSPSVALDEEGRMTTIAIIPDEIGSRAAYQNGWTHVYSIPRVWNLVGGKISQQPHPALQKLREHKTSVPAQEVAPGKNLLLSAGTHQVEIEAEFIAGERGQFGLILGKSPDGQEYSKIYFDLEKGELVVDQSASSKREHIPLDIRRGKYPLDKAAKVKLHLFIDGSVVEGFINDGDAFTTRLFPQSPLSNRVEVFAEGGKVQVTRADVWKLKQGTNKTDFRTPVPGKQ